MSELDPSSAEFFEAKYRLNGDPWNFAGSAYELGRYDATMAALSGRRYRRAFEPGCAVGVLTERLAGICDAVEAVDVSPTAVKQARERCAAFANVRIRCEEFSESTLQDGALREFDLIVLSEIGYYFEPERWSDLAARLSQQMQQGATLLSVHWLGHSEDHRMSGDQVHVILRESSRLRLEHAERQESFRLDRWVRV